MNKYLLVGLLVLTVNAQASVINIGFDHTPAQSGTSIGTDYSADGVVFVNAFYSSDVNMWASGEPDSNTMNGILNQPISGYFNGVTNYIEALVKFADGYTYLSGITYGPTVTTLSVWDINDVFLGSANVCCGQNTISISMNGIHSFKFEFSNDNPTHDDIIGIDYLAFNSVTPAQRNSVPEPVSIALLGLGLAGLGIRRRKS